MVTNMIPKASRAHLLFLNKVVQHTSKWKGLTIITILSFGRTREENISFSFISSCVACWGEIVQGFVQHNPQLFHQPGWRKTSWFYRWLQHFQQQVRVSLRNSLDTGRSSKDQPSALSSSLAGWRPLPYGQEEMIWQWFSTPQPCASRRGPKYQQPRKIPSVLHHTCVALPDHDNWIRSPGQRQGWLTMTDNILPSSLCRENRIALL